MFHVPAHKNLNRSAPAGEIHNNPFQCSKGCFNEAFPDFVWARHGSVCILTALSKEGAQWVEDFLPPDAAKWCGGTCIQTSSAQAIVNAIEKCGLTIELQSKI